MKFICAQPAIDYYTWQVEVMINNFVRNGVNPKDIHIVCGYSNEKLDKWEKLKAYYKDVNFFFYKDERQKPYYISSIRPHVLYKHWLLHPELEKETVFYHDCDIIFSRPIDFTELEKDDICYVSDTVSYIGARYVRSKGEHYLDLMTDIVGVNKDYVIEQERNSGGAQYILKNIPTSFWSKVYYDCERLWTMVNAQIKKDKPPHAIQIWCADMWAVLWNLWFFDKKVQVTKDMSFSWGTSPIVDWDRHPIYHNAGVVGDKKDMFFKGMYQARTPYDIDLTTFNSNYCCYKYAEEILKTKEVTCLK